MWVRVTQGPSTGPDAWFIHGLDGSGNNWDRLAAGLRGHTTSLAPDLPGSGQSGPPTDHDYAITTEADLVAALIRRRGRPVHLAGNSRGGIVATALAARHPELVRTLTLISPAVPDLRLWGERGADPRLALVLAPGAVEPLAHRLAAIGAAERAAGLVQMCFGEPGQLTRADLAAAAAEFDLRARLPWGAGATVRSLRSLIRYYLRPGRWSFWAQAGRIQAPVLVVWGARDRLVDVRLARRTVRAFPHAELLVLERTGHVAQMERPTTVASAMLALWAREPMAAAAAAATGAPAAPADRIVAA